MLTIGRLKYGDLLMSGEIDERLPNYTNGLHIHYPFDYTLNGRDYNRKRNSLDIKQWSPGTFGDQGDFHSINPSSYFLEIDSYVDYESINDFSFSPDGKYLAIVHDDNPYFSLFKIENKTLDLITTFELPAEGKCVTFFPDGINIAVGYDGSPYFSILKLEEETITSVTSYTLDNYPQRILISPNGQYILANEYSSKEIKLLKKTGSVLTLEKSLELDSNIIDMEISSDGEYIVVAKYSDPGLILLRRYKGNIIEVGSYSFGDHIINSISLSKDNYLVVSHENGSNFITLLKRDKYLFNLVDEYQLSNRVNDIKFSPNDKILVLTYDSSPYIGLMKKNGDNIDMIEDYTIQEPGSKILFLPDNEHIILNSESSNLILLKFVDFIESNSIIRYINPLQNIDDMWATKVLNSSNEVHGGWENYEKPIDPSKTYRFTVWIRREDIGNAVTFFGVQPSTVTKLGEDLAETDPFFIKLSKYKVRRKNNRWLLLVAHVRPSDYSGTEEHPDTGIYDTSGRKIYSKLNDFKWAQDVTSSGHRVYVKGTAPIDGKHYFYRPRMEVLEPDSPKIMDIILGMEDTVFIPEEYNNENISFTLEGIGLHESTENLIPYPLLNTGDLLEPLDLNWGVKTKSEPGDLSREVKLKRIMRYHNYDNSFSQAVAIQNKSNDDEEMLYTDITEGFQSGDFITFSSYVKSNVSNKVRLSIEYFDQYDEKINTINSNYLTNINKFERLYVSGMIPNNTEKIRISVQGINEIGEYMEIYLPQLETKLFMTSFTDGFRNDSVCKVPFKLKAPYTINIDFTPSVPNSIEENINIISGDSISNKIWFWKNESEDFYRIRLNGDSDNEFVLPSNLVYQYNRSIITIAVGEEETRVYINGQLIDTKNIEGETEYIEYLDLSSNADIESGPNHVMHSLSIYDKVLSPEEISDLFNNKVKFRIGIDGSINGTLIEKSSYIPDDAYYWPLGEHTLDENLIFDAHKKENLVFENGYVWLTSARSQLFELHENTSSFDETVGDDFKTLVFNEDSVIYRYEFHKETNNHKGSNVSVIADRTYFFSVEIFVSPDYNGTYDEFIKIDEYPDLKIRYNLNKKGSWQKLTGTFTTTSSKTIKIFMVPCYQDNTASRGYIVFKNPMLTNTTYELPFNISSIKNSHLKFNLHEEIGLDWRTDWSIIYWKIPKGTNDIDFSGYSIESLGKLSDPAGGGYRWWGKNNNGINRIVAQLQYHDIDPNKFFNRPHMISIVRSGNNIKYRFWGVDDTIYEMNETLNITKANHFVCDEGYDLNLGGYGNINCNTIYRNLIVLKRALSDDIIEKIFNTPLKIKDSEFIYVSGTFSDGCVL